jgi:hypothetical protein
MRDGVVPKFEYSTVHPDDIVVATDHIASGDFVVSDLAENTGGESWKTVSASVVCRVGKAKYVKPADPELSGAMFAIAEAWGFEGPY